MNDEPESEGPEPGMALVMTDAPVEIEVAPIEDERTPEGMVCLGTTLRGKLIARCVVSPDMWSLVDRTGMLRGPVPLALSAIEEDPGLQCRLFAVTRLPAEAEEEERENEPWRRAFRAMRTPWRARKRRARGRPRSCSDLSCGSRRTGSSRTVSVTKRWMS